MLVVNVEGVLPDVNVQKGNKSAGLLISDEILVSSGTVFEALGLFVVHEPSPT